MNWQPVTESDANTASPTDAIPFVLTPYERSQAACYSVALEYNRRKVNEIDSLRAKK